MVANRQQVWCGEPGGFPLPLFLISALPPPPHLASVALPTCYFPLLPIYPHVCVLAVVMLSSQTRSQHFEHIRRQKHEHIQEITKFLSHLSSFLPGIFQTSIFPSLLFQHLLLLQVVTRLTSLHSAPLVGSICAKSVHPSNVCSVVKINSG